MRRLIRRSSRARDERGVSAVLLALLATCLVGATGLGVDTSGLVVQRSKVQHSADAGALAIGIACVKGEVAVCTSANAPQYASDNYATPNSQGGLVTIPGGVSSSSTQVTVDVSKSIDLLFMPGSRSVNSTATAQWAKHVVRGNVIPFAVSLCAYVQALPRNTPTFIRSDLNDGLKTVKKNDLESTLVTKNLLGTACSKPTDVTYPGLPASMRMVKGGLWISKGGSNNVCNGKIDLDVLQRPDDVIGKNEGCTKRYSNEDVRPAFNNNEPLLLAIYAPAQNYNYGGLHANGAVGTGNGKVADATGQFGIRIVGFAPFKVTGWCLGQPLACGGASTGGAEGLAGSFIGTPKEFDGANYGTGGGNFGAVKVELIN